MDMQPVCIGERGEDHQHVCLGDLMYSMLLLLGSDEGGVLFPHILLQQLPPPVRAALANPACLSAGDHRGLVEEADRVLLATRRFTMQHARSQESELNLETGKASPWMRVNLHPLRLNDQSKEQSRGHS